MKKLIFLAAILASSAASADSFLAGDWCGLTITPDGNYVRTTDLTTVLQIVGGGNFKMATIGNTAFEVGLNTKLSGYISQGVSHADMQPDLGPKFQEAKIDSSGNLVLEFIDGSRQKYAACEDERFIEALNESF